VRLSMNSFQYSLLKGGSPVVCCRVARNRPFLLLLVLIHTLVLDFKGSNVSKKMAVSPKMKE
jgi:hypothetical protein